MLTDQCKEAFEKWLYDWEISKGCFPLFDANDHEQEFNALPFSMQWGVYLEFFDSVGIYVNIAGRVDLFWGNIYVGDKSGSAQRTQKSRPEAQTEAITKANEIFNENN